ncbi:hypothetical protein FF098_008740 [Parvularcula flava]|uniref:Uncharacterized protein n=1 Tax=Aquisalinus luteolus TaxID=1566827 RepID=A0A8J3A7Z1_9PROT|nr:hypothetical protein [Aquisalinus luteolus]NHK27988.1 hypothetical protein [Aquisalinus luteolus]GGH97133.1 hypothetical protein GCM10011355_17610 [Aquisalinus luteolus]
MLRISARAVFAIVCMLTLSSLTIAPDPAPAKASIGLAIQQVDIGDAVAGLRLPSLMIVFLLVVLPVGYWLLARRQLQRRTRNR